MTLDQENKGVSHLRFGPSSVSVANPVVGMHPLQQASMRISEFRDGRSLLKAKDLVGLLLCHGARAWRGSQPVAHLSLRVETPGGTPAIRLKFQRS
ncbi:MAG: hypothetical protein H7Y08_13020 [Rhizobiaceae bacterium]|nr:hypothetical protein [Rhizobiaceae bacterium]